MFWFIHIIVLSKIDWNRHFVSHYKLYFWNLYFHPSIVNNTYKIRYDNKYISCIFSIRWNFKQLSCKDGVTKICMPNTQCFTAYNYESFVMRKSNLLLFVLKRQVRFAMLLKHSSGLLRYVDVVLVCHWSTSTHLGKIRHCTTCDRNFFHKNRIHQTLR